MSQIRRYAWFETILSYERAAVNIFFKHKTAVLGNTNAKKFFGGFFMQQGLTSQKARENLEKYGENKLEEKKKKSLLARFFAQLADAMVIILLVAAAVSLAIAIMGHDKKEFLEPIVILGIVILNAVMGVVQEGKAEKALASPG